VSILIRLGNGDCAGRAFERIGDDHRPAAARAAAGRQDVFAASAPTLGGALSGGEQLADSLDVVGANRACEQGRSDDVDGLTRTASSVKA
jgi:hypothetical protein